MISKSTKRFFDNNKKEIFFRLLNNKNARSTSNYLKNFKDKDKTLRQKQNECDYDS